MSLLERLVEPERVISFAWYGLMIATRYRSTVHGGAVQLCHRPVQRRYALPSIRNLSILKFLGFEQTFKNALTTCRWAVVKAAAISIRKEKAKGSDAFLPGADD